MVKRLTAVPGGSFPVPLVCAWSKKVRALMFHSWAVCSQFDVTQMQHVFQFATKSTESKLHEKAAWY